MANLPPPEHAADFPDDEPVNSKPAPIIPHHAPAQPEGYVSEDNMEDDEEEDPNKEPKKEPIEQDDDEKVEEDGEDDDDDGVNDNEDEAEVINAYEEFGHKFHVRESSSVGTLLAGNGKVNPLGPTGCNLKSIHRVVTRLDKQMFDRIMPPKGMLKVVIQKLVVDKVAEALEADRAARNNPNAAGGSGGNGG
uniref:Uncharacterized protein n=1 Tax=Tanacetum cinerariifolium TaxID=118510 RepID=A0A6L2J1C3_TANCI|nr:hypothetical protein [Tanacetum cinerariifolium]